MKRIISLLFIALLATWFLSCDQEGDGINKTPVTAVRLSYRTINLTEGDSTNMKVFIIPEDATNQIVEWNSSNNQVATVKDGLIKAVKEGKAYITAMVESIKDSCLVIVDKRYIPVMSVILPDSLKIYDGDKDTLNAVILPEDATDKSIFWESSEIKIATVNDGIVEAKRTGKTFIKATCGQHTDSCKIIVLPKIVLNEDSITLGKNEKYQLTASINGNDPDYDIIWSSSNDDIVSVDQNGEITTKMGGVATIIASIGDKEAYCHVKVYVPLETFYLNLPTNFITSNTPQFMYVETEPFDATVDDFYWSVDDLTIINLSTPYGITNELIPIRSGKTVLHVTETSSEITAEVEITIKIPAYELSSYAKNYNHAHYFNESATNYYTVSTSTAIGYSLLCTPEGAYVDDLEITIDNPSILLRFRI